MTYIADFHVHSRHSRATSKNLDLENLHLAAQLKGLAVVGTGDATHPAWFAEIKSKLDPVGDGLLRLKADLQAAGTVKVPVCCRADVRFILVAEISNIYKKNGITRKNHNLVFMPSLDAAARFNQRLDAIGNIRSDGRPILGLDARDLLEIVLETDDRAFLIPAHIWTPWFSLLGSKSGFDSLEECFEDLTPHVFAAETGLSSDPAMNRLVSRLDRLTLISNSDAHSPSKLAREANLFAGEPGFTAIRTALEHPQSGGFQGTIEFYPEEGKYHLDGHRKCGVALEPAETRQLHGSCPVCGRPLTVGVFNRVQALADRTPETVPEGFPAFESLIPLDEILAEVLQVGPATKTVARAYALALATLGNELDILREVSGERIETLGIPLLGEAIRRMRAGKVDIKAGYDGEFGRIRIFSDQEKRALLRQRALFPVSAGSGMKPRAERDRKKDKSDAGGGGAETGTRTYGPLRPASPTGPVRTNPEQHKAITFGEGPLLIVAGPGTGKTRTLTHRIAHLIQERGIPAATILAVTFTQKAAEEMQTRLNHLLDERATLPLTATFHGLCWRLLREDRPDNAFRILDDEERSFMLKRLLHRFARRGDAISLAPDALLTRIVEAKQALMPPEACFESVAREAPASQFARVYRAYQAELEDRRVLDFEELIFRVTRRLEIDAAYRDVLRERFRYVFVDEYQDLNHAQYRLVRALVAPGGNLCVIGDPDQAIYGFRGSDVAFFNRFVDDYPDARTIHLTRNYRSTETILEAAWQVIRHRDAGASGLGVPGSRLYSGLKGVPHVAVVELPTEKAEAVAVGQTIEKAVGGAGFLAIDAGKVDGASAHEYSFADFAVLFRTSAQADVLAEVFDRGGIPFQLANRRRVYNSQPGIAALLSLLYLAERAGSVADLNRIGAALQPPLETEALMHFIEDMECRGLPLHRALEAADPNRYRDLPARLRRRLGKALADLKRMMEDLQPLSLQDRIRHLARRLGIPAAEHPFGTGEASAVTRLLEQADRWSGDAGRFLAAVALETDADMVQPRVEKVTLATLHAAKGLEFPVVFVVGCEDGLIPLRWNGNRQAADLEEERRLFYVALTRARDRLYLSWSRKRRVHGRREARMLSPFVSAIEQQLLCHQAPRLTAAQQTSQVQLKLF